MQRESVLAQHNDASAYVQAGSADDTTFHRGHILRDMIRGNDHQHCAYRVLCQTRKANTERNGGSI